MYNLHLSAEQLEIRDTVRDFVTQEIKPVALKPARLEPHVKPLLTDVLEQASRLGLRTLAALGRTGRHRRRHAHPLHRHRGAGGRRSRRRRRAGADLLARRSAVQSGRDARAARPLPDAVPAGRPLPPRARRTGARSRDHARHQLSPAGNRPYRLSDDSHPRGRRLDHQRPEGRGRQRAGSQAVCRAGRRRRLPSACFWCRETLRD